jgi:peptidoglycan/LPS O-acetylase OafA/YrhL
MLLDRPLKGSRSTKKGNKLYLIQAFRGLAALAVFLVHITFVLQERLNQTLSFNPFAAGWMGVDFFFVLSGFIIFYVHYADLGRSWRLGIFLKKRFIRIYPIYWAIALPFIALQLLLPSLAQQQRTDFVYYLLSLGLLPQPDFPALGGAWTLIHEVFFYAVFALLIWVKPIMQIPIVITLTSGVLLRTAGIFDSLIEHSYLFEFITRPVNLEFILGCIAAYLTLQYRLQFRQWIFAAGLLLLVLSAIVFGGQKGFSDPSALARPLLFGVPCFLLVVGAASIDRYKPIQVPQIFNYLGNASYSLYLTHGPIQAFLAVTLAKLQAKQPLSLLINFLLIFAIAMLVGCFTYSYVEKPMLQLLQKKLLPSFARSVSETSS